jgi:hypothetical protein
MDNLDLAYLEDRLTEVEYRLNIRRRPTVTTGFDTSTPHSQLRCDIIGGVKVNYILDRAGNIVSVENEAHAARLEAFLGKNVPRPEPQPERPTKHPKIADGEF